MQNYRAERNRNLAINEKSFSRMKPPSRAQLSDLCVACGLCCNGALFHDVKLRDADGPAREAAKDSASKKFPQPCAHFCDGLCRIYAVRPAHCREFECALRLRCAAGRVSMESARRRVAATLRLLDRVRSSLRALGENDEAAPVKQRMRRITRRLEKQPPEPALAARFAKLTVDFHRLQTTLARLFYPGAG
jgi:hypothetical protein